MPLEIEHISVKLSADSAGYSKSIVKMVDDTTAGCKKMMDEASRMVQHVETESAKASKAYENIGQSAMKAALQSKKAAEEIASNARLAAASAEFKASAPSPLAGFEGRFAGMRAGVAELQQTTQQMAAAEVATSRFAGAMTGLGGALQMAAPFIGIVNAEAGLAAFGIWQISTVCPVAGAAIATLGGSIVATTYLLRGQDAAANSLNDTLELGKIILAGASFGYADFTEATRLAAEGEKALASQMASGHAMVQTIIAERKALISGLVDKVQALGDVSAKAESKFVEAYRGTLGQKGVKGPQLDQEEGRAHAAFEARRVDDLIASLKKQAEALNLSKEAQIAQTLADNHASQADRERVASLQKLIAVEHEKAKAVKDAEHSAAHAAAEAKRHAEHAQHEMERANKQIFEEGRRLAEQLRTPQEKLAAEMQHVQSLLDAGAISLETYNRQVDKLHEEKKHKEKKEHHAKPQHLTKDSERQAFRSLVTAQLAARSEMTASRQAARHSPAAVVPPPAAIVGNIPTPAGRHVKPWTPDLYLGPKVVGTQAQRDIEAYEEAPSRITSMMARSYAGAGVTPMPTPAVAAKAASKETSSIEKLTTTLDKNNDLVAANNEQLKQSDSVQLVAANI